MDLCQRWLQAHGANAADCEALSLVARQRAQRYDMPMCWVWPLVVALLDALAPLLVLGRWQRARTLDADALDALEQALHHHRWPWPRILWQLARLPLWEALYGGARALEPVPAPTPTSPLDSPVPSGTWGPLVPVPAPVPDPAPVAQPAATRFDVIVVGSGAGGAPVATELAQHGLRVVILEAGGPVVPLPPPRALESYYGHQGMIAAMNQGLLAVLIGRGAGGTTAINSGTSLAPPAEWLARWDVATGGDFCKELPPFVALASERIGVTVPPVSLLGASAHLFEQGLQAQGRTGAYVLPRNAPNCKGSGVCCFGCPTGAKQSTDRSFLPAAVQAGAELRLHTRVIDIREDEGGVRVTVSGPDGESELRARHLVLAAGALATPGLIRRGELGPNWRKAGQHLKIHPATKVFGLFEQPVHGEIGVPQGMGYQPPELERIVLEGIFTPRSTVAPVVAAAGQRARWWLEHADHLASFGLMVRDRGHGSVREVAGWPVLNYRLHAEDALDLARGVLLIAETWIAAGAQAVLLPVAGIANEPTSLAELRRIRPQDITPSRLVASGFHPQGTAGIGRVVDRDLRLTSRISVCDGSVLPDTPGVNPQLTIMALSLRLAQRLKGELA